MLLLILSLSKTGSILMPTISLFGGGQDYEQHSLYLEDLPDKKEDLERFIHDNGVVLAICGGFQLLGQYYWSFWANVMRILVSWVTILPPTKSTNQVIFGDSRVSITKNFNEILLWFWEPPHRTLGWGWKTVGQGRLWEMGTKKMGAKGFAKERSWQATHLSCLYLKCQFGSSPSEYVF